MEANSLISNVPEMIIPALIAEVLQCCLSLLMSETSCVIRSFDEEDCPCLQLMSCLTCSIMLLRCCMVD